MRCHQVLTNCQPGTSVACRRWICGHAPTNATTGESTKPAPSAIGSVIGLSASAPIRIAPRRAMGVITSIPSTQWTAAVDRATESVSRMTSAADQKRPALIDSRTRLQILPKGPGSSGNSSIGRPSRPSGDAYRIARPHQPCEVVAGANHVEVDVLAQVEARVLVRATEAGGVEVEDDQAGAPAAHGLEKAHPPRVGARRDHGDRAPGQAADAVPGERLRQRRAAVGLADRQVVEDQAVLADRAVWLEDRALGVVGDETDLAAAAVHLGGHRGGEADGVLHR